ncbi:hypothetical protein Nepgr_009407 [Nepenthes gracilis]|uniref:Uncharacterized protein n=1 Tax=Nepenthes gracilis TaxID=150966 RepID=A0AAD3SAT6_NEPGR|nr:hypothetical protein Nepgr_009407 [Nepenthes gracilis]
MRSFSFKPASSGTIQRILSVVSDLPPANELESSILLSDLRIGSGLRHLETGVAFGLLKPLKAGALHEMTE